MLEKEEFIKLSIKENQFKQNDPILNLSKLSRNVSRFNYLKQRQTSSSTKSNNEKFLPRINKNKLKSRY